MQLKAIPKYQYYYASKDGGIFSITPKNRSAFFDASKLTVQHVKGNVYTDAAGNEIKIVKLKPAPNSLGYMRVQLCLNGKCKREFVHRLVLMTYKGNFPPGKETNHIDGNIENNKLNNLEFVTRSENMIHAAALERRRSKKDITKYTPGDPF